MEGQTPVDRGIALLDKHGPKDWRKKIDCDLLNLESCHNCVLGQLFGDYGDGLLTLQTRVNYGSHTVIDIYGAAYGFSTVYSYEELTSQWRTVLGCKK